MVNIAELVANKVDVPTDRPVAGIIGLNPSKTARSPKVWSAAISKFLGDGVAQYVALDVEQNLGAVVQAVREQTNFLGFNLAVPYKTDVMQYLDDVDSAAKACGAVNLVVKQDGKLIGYNVDGVGWYNSAASQGFLPSGGKICLIGAGGTARAILCQLLDNHERHSSEIVVVNRSKESLEKMMSLIQLPVGVKFSAQVLNDFNEYIFDGSNLVVNATTVGQASPVKLSDGQMTNLELYSPLAPADSSPLGKSASEWLYVNSDDIAENNKRALHIVERLHRDDSAVCVSDVIFNPVETLFLRHARIAGFKGMNGKLMNAYQAAEGFMRVLGPYAGKTSLKEVADFMSSVP